MHRPRRYALIINKAKKLGKTLLKRSIPAALKLVTAGIIDTNELTEEALSQLGEKFAEEQIKNYEESKKTVSGFKKELELFAEEICAAEQKFPLIIFIDELDRCRPPYAVQVLEKAKHFFSVKGIVFVLAADRIQLGHSIRSLYGAGMDVDGYLRRFIDFDYNLPRQEKGFFCKAQFARFGLEDFFKKRTGSLQYERGNFINLFNELFSILELTLREQEHCFSLLSLAIRTTQENWKLYPELLSILIVLKIKKPELYHDFIMNKIDVDKVLHSIDLKKGGREFLNSHYGLIIEAYLASCRSHDEATQQIAKYNSIINESKEESEKAKAVKIYGFLQTMEFRDSIGQMNYLLKKIDLVSNFLLGR